MPQALIIMAIIRAIGVGSSKKSMGNVTYRVVRGRTIGSIKSAGSNLPPTVTQKNKRIIFRLIQEFIRAHKTDIDVSFNKTKYGSARNNFMRVNYAALSNALALLAINEADGEIASLSQIEEAVTTYAEEYPTAIIRVLRAGFDVVYLTGAWSSADNPVVSNQPIAYYDDTLLANGQNTFALQVGKVIKVAGTSAADITLEISKDGSPSGQKKTISGTTAFSSFGNETGNMFKGTLKDLTSQFSAGYPPFLANIIVNGTPIVSLTLNETAEPIG